MANEFSVRWHGHAAFTVGKTKKILIDPFFDQNPAAKIKKDDVKADIVIVTHAHFDHLGNAVEIAKKNHATVVTMVELAWMLQDEFKDVKFVGINHSGSTVVDGVRIHSVPAFHSSGYNGKYAGPPMGVVIDDGLSLYHAGDTGIFGDMSLIRDLYSPLISLIPIGGFYTMGVQEATKAVKLLGSRYTIPMHYNTFDLIKADPDEFKRKAESPENQIIVMNVEEEVKFDGSGRRIS